MDEALLVQDALIASLSASGIGVLWYGWDQVRKAVYFNAAQGIFRVRDDIFDLIISEKYSIDNDSIKEFIRNIHFLINCCENIDLQNILISVIAARHQQLKRDPSIKRDAQPFADDKVLLCKFHEAMWHFNKIIAIRSLTREPSWINLRWVVVYFKLMLLNWNPYRREQTTQVIQEDCTVRNKVEDKLHVLAEEDKRKLSSRIESVESDVLYAKRKIPSLEKEADLAPC